MAEVGDTWHRFEDYWTVSCDEWDNPYPAQLHIRHRKMRVVKVTKKGVWIKLYDLFSELRFVLNDSKKRFAHATIEEAKASFIYRKSLHIKLLEARIGRATAAINRIDNTVWK